MLLKRKLVAALTAVLATAIFGERASAIFPPPNGFGAMDYNRDGFIDLLDLDILGANFGTQGGATFEQGDANGDGNVDLLDLDVLGAAFGQSVCDLNGDGAFDHLDLDIFGSNFSGDPADLDAWLEHCNGPIILSDTGTELSVPEPASTLLIVSVAVCYLARPRRS